MALRVIGAIFYISKFSLGYNVYFYTESIIQFTKNITYYQKYQFVFSFNMNIKYNALFPTIIIHYFQADYKILVFVKALIVKQREAASFDQNKNE